MQNSEPLHPVFVACSGGVPVGNVSDQCFPHLECFHWHNIYVQTCTKGEGTRGYTPTTLEGKTAHTCSIIPWGAPIPTQFTSDRGNSGLAADGPVGAGGGGGCVHLLYPPTGRPYPKVVCTRPRGLGRSRELRGKGGCTHLLPSTGCPYPHTPCTGPRGLRCRR